MKIQIKPGEKYPDYHLVNISSMQFAILQQAIMNHHEKVMAEKPRDLEGVAYQQNVKELYQILMRLKK